MIFIYLAIFLLVMHLIGKQFISIMNLREYKHPVLYGTVLYVGVAYAITLLLSVLHVSWNAFYMTISLYNIAVLGILIYTLFFSKKHKMKFDFKSVKIGSILKNNWLVYIVIASFFFLYMCSENGIVYRGNVMSLAGGDDVVYTMISMKNIGVEHILTNRGGVSFDVFSTSLIWNSYWVELLKQDIFSVTRLFMSLLSYILVFFCIDEVIFLFFKENYKGAKYAILVPFLMYFFSEYATEVSKLMFYPWFGNVQVTILLLPMLLVILYHMRYQFAMIFYLAVSWCYFIGNSLGAVVYLTIVTIIIMIAWYFTSVSKPRKIKIHRKTIALIVIVMCLILLATYAYVDIKRFNVPVRHSNKDVGFPTIQSELIASLGILKNKSVGMILGIGIFFYRFFRKETSKLENIVIGSFIFVFAISIAPNTTFILHNLLQFAYRRFLESISWLFIIYGFIQLYKNFKKQILVKIVIFNIAGLLVLSQIYPWYIVTNKKSFSLNHIKYTSKVTPVAEELRNYFDAIEKKDIFVCDTNGINLTNRSQLNENSEKEYVIYNLAIAATQNTFVTKCNVANDKVDYLIIPMYSKDEFVKKANLSDSQIVKEIKGNDNEMSIIIYKVNGLPALG